MQRQLALDGARGFTVLFIPAIHTAMLFSQLSVHDTFFGYFLRFIAEGPGAQVFMTIMGIVFTFKKKYSTLAILKRFSLLLLAGYALNTLKFIVPFCLGGLPVEVQHELQLAPGHEIIQLLEMGDILHFAAIALLIIHGVYRLKNYWCWSLIFAIIIFIGAPWLYDFNSTYVIQLFTGAPPKVFFPVLSWIIYPLIGLTIGYGYQRRKPQTIRVLLIAGLTLLTMGATILWYTNDYSALGFYRPYPAETLVHVAIVLLTLWAWENITPHIYQHPFYPVFQFCSQHITLIYLIQWIFICWLLPFIGYQTMNELQTVIMATYTSVITFSITFWIVKQKKI
jgi:hypothetical protein